MIITVIFILVGIIFFIGTLIYTKNKNNLQEIKSIDKSNHKKIKRTLSNLWGIDGFSNQVITINKGQHSIIVELESIEYSLLHEVERNAVDRELISIAQMLKFPIQFLEVKKQIELGDILEEIKINTMNSNDNIKEYIIFMPFIDTEKLHRLNIFYRNNKSTSRRIDIITLKENKQKIEEILSNKTNIIELDNYLGGINIEQSKKV